MVVTPLHDFVFVDRTVQLISTSFLISTPTNRDKINHQPGFPFAGSKPAPACMDLLSNLAQVCARFTELTPEGEGLRGCTLLEPTLLGDVQAQYPVGCFRMGPFGMTLDPEREPVVT